MCNWSFLYAFVPILIGLFVIDYKQDILAILRFHLKEIENEKYDLVIYIPSAIENFAKRKIIRDTWKSSVFNNNSFLNRTLFKFVIGKEGCEIPVELRKNPYSCHPWMLNKVTVNEEQESVRELKLLKEDEIKSHVYPIQKIHFIIHHSIVLNQLGLHGKCRGSKVAVKLYESLSKKLIVSVIFEKLSLKELNINFTYLKIESLILPKGFQGTIEAENLESGNSKVLLIDWNKNVFTSPYCDSNAIEFLEFVDPLPSGNYIDEMKYLSMPVYVTSFTYILYDIDLLINSLSKRDKLISKYKESVYANLQKLEEEIKKYKDLYMVNVIDVYANLPDKFLKFTKKITSEIRFKYLLKVDDDCFVDLKKILSMLLNLPQEKQINSWIGRFRNNWPVERFGKWAENNYPSPVYPKFSCGSGYILTADIVQWISQNANYLKHYQGEDVSLGIWLSALSLQYIDDPYWQCTKDCLSDMYVMPELNADEMRTYWNNKVQCNDACGC